MKLFDEFSFDENLICNSLFLLNTFHEIDVLLQVILHISINIKFLFFTLFFFFLLLIFKIVRKRRVVILHIVNVLIRRLNALILMISL